MSIISKIKKVTYKEIVFRILQKIVSILGLWTFPSFWHNIIKGKCENLGLSEQYYTARPNPRAGIGRQMANRTAGYWWAKQFGLKFVHLPFSTKS